MTKEEFEDEFKLIASEAETKKRRLINRYVNEIAEFKIGDTITNGQTTILIRKILSHHLTKYPKPCYHGDNLTKKMQVNKLSPSAVIYSEKITLVKPAEVSDENKIEKK